MTDLLLRSAERGGDLVAKLAARLRAGEVTPERVAYAAALGYGPALELAEPAEISERRWDQAYGGALLLDQRAAVLWSCDVAEDALRKYWNRADPRPWEAVAAARAWAEDPSEERRLRSEAADFPAWTASVGATAKSPALAARAASRAASGAREGGAAETAADAAWSAVSAAWSAAAADASWPAREEAWLLYLSWLAERLCWGCAA